MRELTLRGPTYTFRVWTKTEAKRAGLIDARRKPGSHAPVSTIFRQGEGRLLAEYLKSMPDAILIATGRYQVTVYRPKGRVK